MITVFDAEKIILKLVRQITDTEIVDLIEATGRVLAIDIQSRLDFPHWDNSAMDGYAVRFADVRSSTARNPVILEIIEEIPAGSQPKREIQSGEAARIFTGSIVPQGADTIVMQEHTQRVQKHFVKVQATPTAKAFIRQRGEYAKIGDLLLAAGTSLNPPEIAILAATGCQKVTVYRRPKIAILSTGNELVAPSQPLNPGQIVDSNGYALAAFIKQIGAIPIPFGIIPDDRARLTHAISEAIDIADFVISTGGVSVGDYDHVEDILAELGGDIKIRAVAIKPGKPLTVAKFVRHGHPIIYFGLPGNPVSALVTAWRFVQPAINKLAHRPIATHQPTWLTATTTEDITSDGKRETYIWGKTQLIEGSYHFTPSTGSHSSGNLINLAGSNALGVVSIDQTYLKAGEIIQILNLQG